MTTFTTGTLPLVSINFFQGFKGRKGILFTYSQTV
jgi:hypothetical protein